MEWHFRNRTPNRFSFVNSEIKLPMKELWNLTLPGTIFDTPIYAERAIYVATTKELYKIDPVTGTSAWNIKSDMPIGTSPAYHKGRIYFSSHTKRVLYCIDSDNGQEIWSMKPGGDAGSCYIDGNNMYLGCRKGTGENQASGFACYSFEQRVEIWFHTCEKSISVNACAADNGILVYGDTAGNVYGLDTATGREIWRMAITDWLNPREEKSTGKRITPHASATPIIVGDIVIITVETPGQMFGLDLKTGKVLWLYKTEGRLWNYHGMAVDDENWYCLTMFRRDPMQYLVFDIKTGSVTLKRDISSYKEQLGSMNVFSRTGLVMGDYHFVGVYAPPRVVAFNKSTGEPVWIHSVDRSNLRGDGRGIFADGKLIWVRNTGDIYCFE